MQKSSWKKQSCCRCGCLHFSKAYEDPGRCRRQPYLFDNIRSLHRSWCFSFFTVGSSYGGTSRNRENTFGQSSCHRVQNHILQRLLIYSHLQVQRGVWETRSPSLWNGETSMCDSNNVLRIQIMKPLRVCSCIGAFLRSHHDLHWWDWLHVQSQRYFRRTWGQPESQGRAPGADGWYSVSETFLCTGTHTPTAVFTVFVLRFLTKPTVLPAKNAVTSRRLPLLFHLCRCRWSIRKRWPIQDGDGAGCHQLPMGHRWGSEKTAGEEDLHPSAFKYTHFFLISWDSWSVERYLLSEATEPTCELLLFN